jgi:hypothetical protein
VVCIVLLQRCQCKVVRKRGSCCWPAVLFALTAVPDREGTVVQACTHPTQ